MSGGSLNYLYSRIDMALDSIIQNTNERKAFVKHMRKIVTALHDIEWVDSGDCSEGSENDSIMAVISHNELIQSTLEDAIAFKKEFEETIQKYADQLIEL